MQTVFIRDSSPYIGVGYTTMTLQKDKFYIFSTQFDETAVGKGDGIRICDLVTGDIPYGSQIQVMDMSVFSTSYDIYKFLAEVYDPEIDDFVTDKWGDGGEEIVSTGIIPVGQGAWIKTAKAVTLDWTSPIQ